ncbi:MAG: transglycosylase domain-containing protein [Agathobacter sp.]|nr:transglycosylase domain-containing protein [Agathobacter sp.]
MAKQKKQKKHRLFWFLVKMQILLMLVVVAGMFIYSYGGYATRIQELRQEAIQLVRESNEYTFVPSQTSIIYDASGEVISFIKGEKEADYVEYEDIPAEFVTAMVSIEDKRFYKHDGIDYVALIRSAKSIIETRSLSQGGSTITMQLARNIYLSTEKTWERKIKEMFIAAELEKLYSKNKIMEYYLNNIYFSNGYYGIKSACNGYFSCELNDLSLSQIAFLCAIPNSPSYYDPIIHMENTLERRDRILTNMYQDGKISESAYLAALNEEIELAPSVTSAQSQRNNYVDTYVYYCATRALMEMEGFEFKEYFASEEEKKEYYEAYDELYANCQKQIFAEGYKIYTSIEMDKQVALQNSVNEVLSGYTDVNEDGVYKLQASAVCIDNESGKVVAIVGGREQDIGIYTLNRAYQSFRQPGSSIKPLIVYTPFFERGNTPDTMVVDEKIEGGPTASYYHGEVTTRYAVEQSLNSVAWSLYTQITPDVGLQYLKNMHFSKIVSRDYAPATSLGGFTKGMSALEMAAGYATLENDGVYRTPSCITKIIDADENIVYLGGGDGTRIYKETAARMMTDVLETAMISGTGKDAKIEGMPCAGKTGTTNDNKDGWFVGYTRYYTTSVWVGCDLPQAIDELQGASYPAQIWKSYMTYANEGLVPLEFLPYAQLSPEFMEEYYPEDTEEEDEESSEGDENSENEDTVDEGDAIEGGEPEEGDEPVEGDEPLEGDEPIDGEDTP